MLTELQLAHPYPADPIFVGSWGRHEDFPVFPVGSKPKRMLVAPVQTVHPWLIPGHSYLFKTADGWRAQQVWSEVIAFRIAMLLGIPAPPCFVAVDQTSGQVGVLCEFFYGYPWEQNSPRLVHAADLLANLNPGMPPGRPHNVVENLRACKIVGAGADKEWWATTLAFDALLGNTDRHSENWGFLVWRDPAGSTTYQMAPLYDHGTSLGYEVPEAKLADAMHEVALERYIQRGRHNCGWNMQSDRTTPHLELCARTLKEWPEASGAVGNVIRFSSEDVRAIVEPFAGTNLDVPFTRLRAEFVHALVCARLNALERLLGA